MIAKAALLTHIIKVDEQAKMAALSKVHPDASAPSSEFRSVWTLCSGKM